MTNEAGSQGVQVGVSSACFFPLETEQAVSLLMDAGERNIELFVNSFSELEPQFTHRIIEMVRASGGKIISVHPFTSNLEDMLFSPYARRRQDMMELYKKYFAFAAEAGASYVVLHGPSKMFHMSMEFYAEQFWALDQIARQMGVQILQENVERCMSRDIALLAYMHRQLPDAGFTLDLKQARRCGIDTEQFFRTLGPAIKHIHFSDSSGAQECLWPGMGAMDIPDFMEMLRRYAYDGCLMVEVYGCKSCECSILEACAEKIRAYTVQQN